MHLDIVYRHTQNSNWSRAQSTVYKRKTCSQKAACVSVYALGIICSTEKPLDWVLVSHIFLDLRFRCHWIIKISMTNANWKMNGTISVFVSLVLACTPQTYTHTGLKKKKRRKIENDLARQTNWILYWMLNAECWITKNEFYVNCE